MAAWKLFLAVCACMSLFTFILYGQDKHRARKQRWRIRESVLLGCAFLGGAVGALLGMEIFRHKTRHWYFWAVALLGLAWQVCAVIFLARYV